MKAFAVAFGLAAGAISITASPSAQAQSSVPVYDSTQIALDRYTVVKRLGVQGWKSGYFIESYRDATTAADALNAEAGRLGADGLINLYCLSRSDRLKGEGHYCYGNAIKLKP